MWRNQKQKNIVFFLYGNFAANILNHIIMTNVLETPVKTISEVATTAAYENMTTEQLSEKIKALQSLLPKKEKKETPDYILERRGFCATIKDELFSFGKVQRSANALLNSGGVDGFKNKLSAKQLEKFVPSRLTMAVKSKTLLLKISNKGKDVLSITPNAYLNLVASFCTLNQKEFDKRKAAK